jgi:hypothetical protein
MFIRLRIDKNSNDMNLFATKVKDYFPKHGNPCIENFILLMECILQTRTVCLYKCRDKVSRLKRINNGKCSENSCYMRLIRFFKMKAIGEFIMGIQRLMFSISATNLEYLIVDRSNWKRGKKSINLLTIGSLMNEAFIPFYWLQLNNKGGGSKLQERTALIEGIRYLAKRAGKSLQASILLADREFIGQNWFEYLRSEKISFVIRMKAKMYFELVAYKGKKNVAPCVRLTN